MGNANIWISCTRQVLERKTRRDSECLKSFKRLNWKKVGRSHAWNHEFPGMAEIQGKSGITEKRSTDFFDKMLAKMREICFNRIWKQRKYCCCTLPMRNWNFLHATGISVCLLCCTLPMRNWNNNAVCIKELYVDVIAYIVVPYLWGIETSYQGYSYPQRLLFCCTLPMRNWNAALPNNNSIIFFLPFVVPYLWGIETSFIFLKSFIS